jgi:hypothetical protein
MTGSNKHLTEEMFSEVARASVDPSVLLDAILSKSDTKVLAFGENHWWNNPHREFLAASLPALASAGFNCLALERERRHKPVFNSYMTGILDEHNFKIELRHMSSSLGKGTKVCPAYLRLIQEARKLGLKIFTIDTNQEDWDNLATSPRDDRMAEQVVQQLAADSSSKIIVYGGSNHMYARTNQTKYLSLVELLQSHFGKKANVVSIAGVVPEESLKPEITFRALYPLCDQFASQAPTALLTYDCPNLAILVLGDDRRCPWGSCNYDCPGRRQGVCSKLTRSSIAVSSWDALVLYSADALRAPQYT